MLFQKLLPLEEGIQGYRTGKRKASESPWSHTLVSDLNSFCFTGAHYWACVFLMCVYTHWKWLSSVSFTVTLQDTLETSKTIRKCKEEHWESQNYFWRKYSARVSMLWRLADSAAAVMLWLAVCLHTMHTEWYLTATAWERKPVPCSYQSHFLPETWALPGKYIHNT